MKNLVLASALGTLAGAFVVPAIGGPVHFAITRPYSLFGMLPISQNAATVSVALGTAPLDFILTDVMVQAMPNDYGSYVFVTVNGNPVFNCGRVYGGVQTDTHMTSGIFIPAGSTIGVQSNHGMPFTVPVTLAGYVQ